MYQYDDGVGLGNICLSRESSARFCQDKSRNSQQTSNVFQTPAATMATTWELGHWMGTQCARNAIGIRRFVKSSTKLPLKLCRKRMTRIPTTTRSRFWTGNWITYSRPDNREYGAIGNKLSHPGDDVVFECNVTNLGKDDCGQSLLISCSLHYPRRSLSGHDQRL